MIKIISILLPIAVASILIGCNSQTESNFEEKLDKQKGQHEILLGMTLGKSINSQKKIAYSNGLMDRMYTDYKYHFIPIPGIKGYVTFNTLTKSEVGINWKSIEALKEFENHDELLVSVDVIYARKDLIDTNYFFKNDINSTFGKKITRSEFEAYSLDLANLGKVYKKLDYRCDSTGFYELAQFFEEKYGKTEPWESADKSGNYAVDLDQSDDKNQPLKKRWQLGQTRIELSLDFLYSEVDDDFKPTNTAWTVKASYTFTNDIWQEIGTTRELRELDKEFEKADKKLKQF